MNTPNVEAVIDAINLDSVRIGRDQLQTDAHDFEGDKDLIMEYAASLEKQEYTMTELIESLERSKFFIEKTKGKSPIERIKMAQAIRYFIQDCGALVARSTWLQEATLDGNAVRRLQDHLTDKTHERVMELMHSRADTFTLPVALESSAIQIPRFSGRVRQKMREGIERAEESLEKSEQDPGMQFLVPLQRELVAQRRDAAAAVQKALGTIMTSLGGNSSLDGASFMSRLTDELRASGLKDVNRVLVILSAYLGDMVADQVLRDEKGYSAGRDRESAILLTEYRTGYRAALRRVAGVTEEESDD